VIKLFNSSYPEVNFGGNQLLNAMNHWILPI
jgi:hypothetical protein